MKPFYLLSLLAAALVASAQQTNNSTDSVAAPVASSVPVDTPPATSASAVSTPSVPPAASNVQASSSDPPQPPSTPVTPLPASQPTTPPPTPTPSPSVIVAPSAVTGADGDVSTVQVTSTITPLFSTTSASSSSPSSTSDNSTSSSSSIGTGGIIGIAVAGGVAVLFLIAFFVWKFANKRKSSFDDTEDIKWPELNAHAGEGDTHPVPVHNTGRSGFDTGGGLSRVSSSANTLGGASVDNGDPYAVPPPPHLNPNQPPYRDDPNAMASGGYYDPYRGPVPQTFNEANGPEWGQPEVIPMTQMSMGGRMSPGPQMAYNEGRASPGPRRASPAPQVAYGGPPAAGRTSPGPQMLGRMSPGPQRAYGGGI